MKIVVAEKISSSAVALLKQPRWTVVTADQLDGKLTSQLESADALIVRSAVQVDARLLEHANKLRVIGRAGVGVDNIDLDAATRKGIAVMNTPGANAVAVAEHTFALMLALARQLSRADATTRAGKWEKKSLQGTELRGKTLGIIGLGRIGLEVARRAAAFGMTLVANDPYVSPAVAKECGIHMTTLDEVYAAADYLTLHVGLTPQTMGMINAGSLKKMKRPQGKSWISEVCTPRAVSSARAASASATTSCSPCTEPGSVCMMPSPMAIEHAEPGGVSCK